MSDGRRTYCTLDHANKRREMARRSPYQFWLEQLRRDSEGRIDERTTERAGSPSCRRGTGRRVRS